MKFYICRHCGNVITKLTSAQVPVKCCGEEMQLLEAGVTDAAQEKHVPAVTVEGSLVKVDVGSVTHPMTAEHFIQWVVVETDRDALIHWFHPGRGAGGGVRPGGGPDRQGRLRLLQPPRSLEEGPVSCETPDRPGAVQRRGGLLTFEIGYI